MDIDPNVTARLRGHLESLYGDRAPAALEAVLSRARQRLFTARLPAPRCWDQQDVVLIAYPDQVRAPGEAPLATLRRFLASHGLPALFRILHVLPFFPSSSDDGFAVMDYHAVDPALGSWDDLRRLGSDLELMVDLVLNHVSSKSAYFRQYVAGMEPFTRFFIEVDPRADLSAVVRPRDLPLLTRFETPRGPRHLWTTFGPDQVDLDFTEPAVLVEMTDVLLRYASEGARIVRLDAIAYVGKQLGTPCIHLPRAHTVVKFLRELLDALAPGVWLLTETNVPHRENVSYFGKGDEARLVYQFSLPPLLLDAILNEDASYLVDWLRTACPPPSGATFLNFTASHDGIGIRPLEGLVPEARISALIDAALARGGFVSTRGAAPGAEQPYELNLTYLDALQGAGCEGPQIHARRFLASQIVALSLRGVAAVYFLSLVGARSDFEGVERTGSRRQANRRRFELDLLERSLQWSGALESLVFLEYVRILAVRVRQAAFHPDADQTILEVGPRALLAFLRSPPGEGREILVLANLGGKEIALDLPDGREGVWTADLLGGAAPSGRRYRLAPWQVAWLV